MPRASGLPFLLALALIATACSDRFEEVRQVPETKDRLSDETMEHLVDGPMAVVRDKGLAQGEAAFDRLLVETMARHGSNSTEAADLLTAFGVQLYVENSDPNSPEFAAARRYLAAAIPAYSAAFGPDHPEVAVALNTLADLDRKTTPQDPPPTVDSLLERALRIRERSLGLRNAETAATLVDLARLNALPARRKRDPNGLARADALYRRAIIGAVPGPEGDERSNKAAIELELAELHAHYGRPDIALAEARTALAISRHWRPAWRRCQLIESNFDDFVQPMSARGWGRQAEAIRPKGTRSACWSDPWPARAFLRRLFGLALMDAAPHSR